MYRSKNFSSSGVRSFDVSKKNRFFAASSLIPGKDSLYWPSMCSRKSRCGSWGQIGASGRYWSDRAAALSGSVIGKLPMPVAMQLKLGVMMRVPFSLRVGEGLYILREEKNNKI